MRSVQTGLARLWASGRNGKIAIVVGGFLVACCALGAIGQLVNPRQAGTPTSAPAAAAPTTAAAPAATAAPAPTTEAPAPTTEAPAPTAVPPTEAPSATPEPPTAVPPTATPEPTQTAEERYVQIAKGGLKTPSLRGTFHLPPGDWSAQAFDNGDGPIAIITFPIGPGMTPEQTVRFAKLQCAQIVKAVFDADASLVQVTAFGTMPDGQNQEELGAVSIVVQRRAYERWSGITEELGEWRIAPRYK